MDPVLGLSEMPTVYDHAVGGAIRTNPQRTFNADGSYDGQLTVTDSSGLKASRDFTVSITK